MIYIGRHIRKVLKKNLHFRFPIITLLNFPIPHSNVRNISTQIFVNLSVTPYENSLIKFHFHDHQIPYGLAVRIPGFHPGGPGSTPGMGTDTFFLYFLLFFLFPLLTHASILFIFYSSFLQLFLRQSDTADLLTHSLIRSRHNSS